MSVAAVSFAFVARAAGTKVWEVRNTAEFAEGKLDGVIATARGELRTGWMLDKVKVEADAVWCVLPDGEGGAYVGTGNKGELFRLKGLPLKGNAVERVAETGAVAITVLRRLPEGGPEGGVLVGTAGEGRVFVFVPAQRDGEPGNLTELVKLDAKYVWDLAVAPDGVIFAATGPEGKLFRITGKEAELWFKSKEPNLISLALGEAGSVYAGSDEKGLLFRVTGKDTASVVYDFGENEVRAIRVRDFEGETGLVIAANAAKSKGGGASAPAPPSPSTQGASSAGDAAGGDKKKAGSPAMPSKEPMNCAVYTLSREGAVESVFSSKGEFIWNLAPLADGTVVVGTGEKGRVYRVRIVAGLREGKGPGREPVLEDGGADVLFDLEEGQALALGAEFGRIEFLGTGNGATLYRTDAAVPGKGRYESKVLDAKFVASWGRLEWDGKGEVGIETRSGATAEPDETWHPWTPVDPRKPFARSPRARYLQFAVSLKGRDAVVRAVRVAYLPDNQCPHVETVIVNGPGGAQTGGEGAKDQAPKAAQAPKHTTSRTITWKASDPDGDALKFRLHYKLEKDPDEFLRAMNPPEGVPGYNVPGYNLPVTGDKFAWETRGLPDGRYVVRVVASDEGANPQERARSAAKDSEPVLIDHTAPTLDVRVGKVSVKEGGLLTATARDTASRITFLAYSVDGGEFKLLSPTDGIFDARREALKVKLPEGLAKGPHALAVQAADEAGNLRTVRVTFRVE